MSINILKIIPTDPSYIPGNINQQKAKIYLSKIFNQEEIEFEITDTIEFIDQGSNFERVSCNFCGTCIETTAWQDAMDSAYEKNFINLSFTSPCCNKQTSLNDLNYIWPAGFAKFVINISDAQHKIDVNDLKDLQEFLGTPLRVIIAHY